MDLKTQQSKVYNALSGLELRKKIMHDIEVAIDTDERFRNHVAYPKVAFRFSLEVFTYPSTPETFTLGVGADPRSVEPEFSSENAAAFSISSEHSPENPDRVRQQISAPIPKAQDTKMGREQGAVVDVSLAQQQQLAQDASARLVEEEPIKASTAPASTQAVVGGFGGRHRSVNIEIPGHAVERPLIIPREPANGKVSISNEAAADGLFGTPVVDITPRRTSDAVEENAS